MSRTLLCCLIARHHAAGFSPCPGGEEAQAGKLDKTVEQLAEAVQEVGGGHHRDRPRRQARRAGHRLRHRADGLIATNLHVIGEARPIAVQTADGKKLRRHRRPRLRPQPATWPSSASTPRT